jgi:hypothetical protein
MSAPHLGQPAFFLPQANECECQQARWHSLLQYHCFRHLVQMCEPGPPQGHCSASDTLLTAFTTLSTLAAGAGTLSLLHTALCVGQAVFMHSLEQKGMRQTLHIFVTGSISLHATHSFTTCRYVLYTAKSRLTLHASCASCSNRKICMRKTKPVFSWLTYISTIPHFPLFFINSTGNALLNNDPGKSDDSGNKS